MDTYLTLASPSEAQLTEKRSRFLAFAIHVDSEDEAKEQVDAFRKKFYDARHVCFAYVLGSQGEATRANDDGEPSGTAGRPILGQIRAKGLTFVLVIVVRYFGGVKLGIGPLGVAYKTVAADVLEKAQVKECILKASMKVSLPYADADVAMRFVREAGAEIVAREYTASHTILSVSVRLDDERNLRERLGKILSLRFMEDVEREKCN